MTDAPNRILNPEWSLVVIYCGTDPYFHQRDSHSPNRPRLPAGSFTGSPHTVDACPGLGSHALWAMLGADRDER